MTVSSVDRGGCGAAATGVRRRFDHGDDAVVYHDAASSVVVTV